MRQGIPLFYFYDKGGSAHGKTHTHLQQICVLECCGLRLYILPALQSEKRLHAHGVLLVREVPLERKSNLCYILIVHK